ncbi:hypothetical protein HMPREF3190_01349 [Umbribacter vaginalis]|nr:hypothetical protein HMPREF3190_01349 [Coriobacteriales bacterium DNF00809]
MGSLYLNSCVTSRNEQNRFGCTRVAYVISVVRLSHAQASIPRIHVKLHKQISRHELV